jgi:hypothetical protein
MSVEIHHRAANRGKIDDNGQGLAGNITECLLSSICVLYQGPLEQKACIEVVEIHVDDGQKAVMKIIVISAIITNLIWSRLPNSAYLLLYFSVETHGMSIQAIPIQGRKLTVFSVPDLAVGEFRGLAREFALCKLPS